jgi:hypothetical protein
MVMAAPAYAGTLGVDFTTAIPGGYNRFVLGYEFVANNDVTVVGLGNWANDLTVPQMVYLWDGQGNLLASTSVTTSDALLGAGAGAGWYFHAITPTDLTAGQTYVVGARNDGDGRLAEYTYDVGGFTVDPNITFVRDRWGYNSDPGYFPTRTHDIVGAFGANIELAGVPEPATWAMTIVGFGGVGAALRRRRLQAAPTTA